MREKREPWKEAGECETDVGYQDLSGLGGGGDHWGPLASGLVQWHAGTGDMSGSPKERIFGTQRVESALGEARVGEKEDHRQTCALRHSCGCVCVCVRGEVRARVRV